jgi:ABC-type transporter Mla MlaB component
MADPKDTTSFFRKVVKFVANPSTEWNELGPGAAGSIESDLAKSELKAMIERKRRNDFVRKREFDMLRKVRREGLTPDQLAALGGSSAMGDSQPRPLDAGGRGPGMKAKIDEIEQQMVGNSRIGALRRPEAFYAAPTEAMPLASTTQRAALGAANSAGGSAEAAPSDHAPLTFSAHEATSAFDNPFASAAVNEIAHDPDLDEAVIAFANADFDLCEQSLTQLTHANGPRAQHAETWLALFDMHRATGQLPKFESLAIEYAQQFGWSAPQWFSMPQRVAEAASEERQPRGRIDGDIGWTSPEWIDTDTVTHLRSQTLQMPLPWVFDWGALRGIDAEASARLSELFRLWMPQKLDMRWLHGDRLLQCVQDASPTGVRDADPVYWQLRLDVLRMTNRPDQFDETAIDYCLTYEVSPPSWERALCQVRLSGSGSSTLSHAMSAVSEVSTSFVESQLLEDTVMVQLSSVELSGQLVGDISDLLRNMTEQLGQAPMINVNCARLIRVDFIAAGDLLNWVLARRAENRSVTFVDAHRLVALFFGAMGINEHATVKVRTV